VQLFVLEKRTRPEGRNIRVNCKINDSLKTNSTLIIVACIIGSSETDFSLFAKMRNVSEYNVKNPDNQVVDACNGLYPTYNTRAFKKESFLVKSFVVFCVYFKPKGVFK